MFRIITFLFFSLLVYSLPAQDYEKFQRKKARQSARIERAERKGKINDAEKSEISKKQQKLDRINRKAVRNGDVNNREQARLNRNLRKVKRETRRAKRN